MSYVAAYKYTYLQFETVVIFEYFFFKFNIDLFLKHSNYFSIFWYSL